MAKPKIFEFKSLMVAIKILVVSILVGIILILPRMLIMSLEGAIAWILGFAFLVIGFYLFGFFIRLIWKWDR